MLRLWFNYTPHLVAIVAGVAVFFYYDKNSSRVLNEAKGAYPLLSKDETLSVRVTELYCPREVRCATPPFFVKLENGLQRSIDAEESVDGGTKMVTLLTRGDSLVKESDSDTLVVYSDGERVAFLLRQSVLTVRK